MYNLIDRAEWKIHEHCVADLLPKFKDAVYDAEDLLDEFRRYEQMVTVEGNATQLSSLSDFFSSVKQGNFSKVVDIQNRINTLSSCLRNMGLHQAPRFDKLVRPETPSFPTEPKIFGRKEELNEVIRLLGVNANSSRSHSRRRISNGHFAIDHNEETLASVNVLPIVGLGGVGKTTLAQLTSKHRQVIPRFDRELEEISRTIVPKLKGSPLAVKTLGRLLGMSHSTAHWNDILNSELWQLKQEETDILPALRLSYMYLPFHLKRCFSFCTVYPKDYTFSKIGLAEIWVAEGFVAPQGNIPLQHIAYQYFKDLVNRSFFQKLGGSYVIHDLMHDMAQLVSKDECVITKKGDFQMVPQNVRHVSILKGDGVNYSDLLSLCKHTKLRTILCKDTLWNDNLVSVMGRWCSELWCMRVLSFASKEELQKVVGSMSHFGTLKFSVLVCSRPFLWRFVASTICKYYMTGDVSLKPCGGTFVSLSIYRLGTFQTCHALGSMVAVGSNLVGSYTRGYPFLGIRSSYTKMRYLLCLLATIVRALSRP
ncbi:putative disease resistance RPP13-like protein 1 [Dichanthelium oligosanthes]|uniref:Putative disease resistance RPP13-like protein 1 n=1 Tax=Dichanthelium oligosanthes TaxID=888268 RepID=A0A1E5W4C2_9POAL|nr:putative disease resistance RPP13-like protein 1 [Dichanthelium oligosanthes]